MNNLQLDAMKELANIGTGHAANALSELIGRRVDMNVPKVDLIPLEQVGFHFGHPEDPVCAIFSSCESSLETILVFIMSLEDSEDLAEMLLKNISIPMKETEKESLRESALSEAGNIILGAFISALGDMVNQKLPLSVPHITVDMLGSVMDIMVGIFGVETDTVFLIETSLSFPENEGRLFSGRIMLVPTPGSLENFFQVLGLR